MPRVEWAQWVQGLGSILVALVVGLIAAGIAYHQFRVARAKLNLDLFEERYKLYEILWSFLSARVGDDKDRIRDTGVALQNSAPKFLFLFGAEVHDFANLALTKGFAHDAAKFDQRKLSCDASDKERSKVNDAVAAGYAWFFQESSSLRVRFASYMDFSAWSR